MHRDENPLFSSFFDLNDASVTCGVEREYKNL